jgi:hypothetical protein
MVQYDATFPSAFTLGS